MSRWKKGNTCVYNVSYHIIWKLRTLLSSQLFNKSNCAHKLLLIEPQNTEHLY